MEMSENLSQWGLLMEILFSQGILRISPDTEFNGYKGDELLGKIYLSLKKEGIRAKVVNNCNTKELHLEGLECSQ